MSLKKVVVAVLIVSIVGIGWMMANWPIPVEENSVVHFHAARTSCSGDKCQENVIPGLVAGYKSFYFNGKPFRILGGSFHYFRTHPKQWRDRLEKMKVAGLNTVTTYVAWNLHEQVRGRYEFRGLFNLAEFIRLVQKIGLHLIVRPGPYICAEWEFGGLPSWLLHDPNMTVRTSKYRPYLDHVTRFFDQLLPLLAKFTYKNGGPIVAFQIENEFGSYGHDVEYMQFLRGLYDRYGIDELLFTSDGKNHLYEGSLPGILTSVNFNKETTAALDALEKFQPDKPLLVTEFWPGWFDHWGEDHHEMPEDEFTAKVDVILSRNASINFYMFVGGTNFGFWNGANAGDQTNLATVTSYDYDALISEDGDVHPTKYKAFQKLLEKHHLVKGSSLKVPQNSPKIAFAEVAITKFLQMEDFIRLLPNKSTSVDPVFMEFLSINDGSGQGYGWILYRTMFSSGNSLRLRGKLQDRALLFVNGKLVKVIHSKSNVAVEQTIVLIAPLKQSNTLDILVENMGRVNYKTLDDQHCGFQGNVELDGKPLSPWKQISLDFSDKFVSQVQQTTLWQSYDSAETSLCLYRGFLDTDSVEDTFLDMQSWTKGIVLVNGFNLGRYWNVGPQQTLYIPKPFLRIGKNEIIVFELEKPSDKLVFVSRPILNKAQAR